MRVVFLVKTSEGARWAALEARELVKQGIEIHAVLPNRSGAMIPFWETTGAQLHFHDLNFPATRPWMMKSTFDRVRCLMTELQPGIIHSHHVTTTLSVRLALGRNHPVPRIFQVPGPLHLEHSLYASSEIRTAGRGDYWIASSRYITELYRLRGVPQSRLFLSYFGHAVELYARNRTHVLRKQLGIAPGQIVVGNMNLIYPPKYYLGQTVGLKCHEDVIDALSIVTRARADVTGVLVGGTFGTKAAYEAKLRARALRAGGCRIYMTGNLPLETVAQAWPDFDLGIHVPLSENCGGVVEPLLAGVPVIASRVGGLPEVVIPGCTGLLVPARNPKVLAAAILSVLRNYQVHREMAQNGQRLVAHMFDVRRTAAEVARIYQHILDGRTLPPRTFQPSDFLENVPSGTYAT